MPPQPSRSRLGFFFPHVYTFLYFSILFYTFLYHSLSNCIQHFSLTPSFSL